jgi:hypothetical protein
MMLTVVDTSTFTGVGAGSPIVTTGAVRSTITDASAKLILHY